MRYTLLYIITLFLLLSCSGKTEQEERYAEIVSQWQGREIKLPAVMTDFLTGDTINLDDADFTILTYIDSTGCTGCKMKLPLWDEFIESIDSIQNAYAKVIIIVNSNDEDEVAHTLIKHDYNHPVYYDKENRIYDSNQFSESKMLQTMLLDKEKKVVAIGNPIFSTKIAELYNSLLSGNISYSTSIKSSVSVDQNRYAFSGLVDGETKSHEFRVFNHSNDTIYIHDIISSCECTVASADSVCIPPESDIPVRVSVIGSSDRKPIESVVNIYFEGFRYPIVLEISGIYN